MPRYDILSPDAMEVLERGWRRLISEIGVEFLHDGALEHFRAAGQTVEDSVVKLDPEFVLEQVAKAPSEFELAARNPDRDVHVGRHAHGVRAHPGSAVRAQRRRAARGYVGRLRQICAVSARASISSTLRAGCAVSPTTSRSTPGTWTCCCRWRRSPTSTYQGAVITEDAASDSMAVTDMVMRGRGGLDARPVGVRRASTSTHRFATTRACSMPDDLRRGRAGLHRDHAVPADGSDGPGLGAGRARPADRRVAGGACAHPADPAGRAGDPWGRFCRTPTCSPARRDSVAPSRPPGSSARGRSPVGSACRGGPAEVF